MKMIWSIWKWSIGLLWFVVVRSPTVASGWILLIPIICIALPPKAFYLGQKPIQKLSSVETLPSLTPYLPLSRPSTPYHRSRTSISSPITSAIASSSISRLLSHIYTEESQGRWENFGSITKCWGGMTRNWGTGFRSRWKSSWCSWRRR